MTWAWIETSRADTGSSPMMSLVSSASARAMPIRCRCPPGELVGVAPHLIGAEPDPFEQLRHALLPAPRRSALVDDERLADNAARRHARIEGRVRVLEDDLHRSPEWAHVPRTEVRDVVSVHPHPAFGGLDELDDRLADGRLSAAGLADEPQGLALANRERDAVDRVDVAGDAGKHALSDRKVGLQSFHREHRRTIRRAVAPRPVL